MLVPPGGGPPLHRHDFEEMFAVLDGEIELTFRGETHRAGTGTVVNIPANAPHKFRNTSDRPAHLLCLCAPPGQEDFFLAVGDPLESRDSPPPALSDAEKAERRRPAQALAAHTAPSFSAPDPALATPAVEDAAAAEKQHQNDDDEQGVRVHVHSSSGRGDPPPDTW